MQRGPTALFGAIVALGLGPAMWLGAQFGGVPITPVQPPAITVDQVRAPGGVGAGEEPDDTTEVLDTKAAERQRPVAVATTPRPTITATRVRPTATAAPSTASPSAEPSATATTSAPPVSDAPTESTETPVEPTVEPTSEQPGPLDVSIGVALGWR